MRRPAIPGLTFRNARPDDWATADRRRQRGPGRPTAWTRSSSPTRCAPSTSRMDWFDIGRDVLIAEIDGETVGTAFGWRVQRGTSLALETLGRRPGGAPPPGHRHGPPSRHPRPPGRRGGRGPASRRAIVPLVGPRHRAVGHGAAPRRGLRPHSVRVRDAPVPHRGPARARPPRRPRAPAGHPRPASGHLRRRQRGLPRPLGPPRAGRGRLPAPATSTRRRTPRCGVSPGTATRSPDRS